MPRLSTLEARETAGGRKVSFKFFIERPISAPGHGTFRCAEGEPVTVDSCTRVLGIALVVVSLAGPSYCMDGKSKGAELAFCETSLARFWQEYHKDAPFIATPLRTTPIAAAEADDVARALATAAKGRRPLPHLETVEARVKAADDLLGKTLSPQQQQALERAHEVGLGQRGKDGGRAGHYNYTSAQIKEKLRILRDAGFSKEDRAELLRAGIAGVRNDLPIIPKGFGVTRDMAKWVDDAEKIIRRYSVCGHCKTPLERLERLDEIRKSASGTKLKELNQAYADLELAWNEAERMHSEFRAMNGLRAFPYGFKSQGEWDIFRREFVKELRNRLNKPGAVNLLVDLGGSATDGLSFIPKMQGIMRKPFGATSDLDIVITVSEKHFKELFPPPLSDHFVEKPGHSYALDMEKLEKAIAKAGAKTDLSNMPYFVKQMQQKAGGRKVSLKLVTERPISEPGARYVPLHEE